MKTIAEVIRIEILFNSVEMELARQHHFGNVPRPFVDRPAMHIRLTVGAWWNFYHESLCARQQRSRTVWERNPAYPSVELNPPALVASLNEIRELIDIEIIEAFRPLSNVEEAGICLLALITAYYTNPQSETWKQML